MMSLKVAKILVCVMSILLILGILFLVMGLYLGWNTNKDLNRDSSAMGSIETVFLKEPAGSQIDRIAIDGSSILLSLSEGGLSPRILVIDRQTGQIETIVSIGEPP